MRDEELVSMHYRVQLEKFTFFFCVCGEILEDVFVEEI